MSITIPLFLLGLGRRVGKSANLANRAIFKWRFLLILALILVGGVESRSPWSILAGAVHSVIAEAKCSC